MIIGPVEHKTNIRFKKMDDFESYINALDFDYDSENVVFAGVADKLKTPQFNRVNRSQYGRGTSFRHDIVEYIGINCYVPTSGKCFLKCNKYLT